MEHLLIKLADQTFNKNNTWICFFKTGLNFIGVRAALMLISNLYPLGLPYAKHTPQ
jgi:hypothetical protein